MAVQTRKRRKSDLYALTPKLRDALATADGSWGLNQTDERRLRGALARLPEYRLGVLQNLTILQRQANGKPVTRQMLAEECQAPDDIEAPVKPLYRHTIQHLEALVFDGFIEKHRTGHGSEYAYVVPPGLVWMLKEISREKRERALEQRRAYLLMDAAEVVNNLKVDHEINLTPPLTEAHARPLTSLEPAQQPPPKPAYLVRPDRRLQPEEPARRVGGMTRQEWLSIAVMAGAVLVVILAGVIVALTRG